MSGKSLLSLSMGGVMVTAVLAVVGLSYIATPDNNVGAQTGSGDDPLDPLVEIPLDEPQDVADTSGADVGVTKSVDVQLDSLFGRDQVVYTTIVTNAGPATAANVLLEDNLPSEFITGWAPSGSAAADCTLDGGLVTCDFGDLASGAQRTLVLTSDLFEVGCGDAVLSIADVTADNDDTPENNEAQALVERTACFIIGGGGGGGGGFAVQQVESIADVTVSKDAVVSDGSPGSDQVTYDIVVSSIGDLTAENVTLTDLLPNLGTTWSLSGPDAGDCTLEGDLLTCDFGDLASGESRSFSVASDLCDFGCGPDIVNHVEVGADNDGDLSNNEDSATIEREDCPPDQPIADVAVEKEGALENDTGDTHRITFFVTVRSIGDLTAENVTLVDELPDFNGLPWMVGGPDSGDCSTIERTIVCDFGDLEPGEIREFHVWSRECELDCWDALTNSAEVHADNDGNATNNFATATVVLECPEDVGVTKIGNGSVDDDPFSGFDEVSFTIIVESFGPFPAQNAFLVDELPDVDGLDWTISGDIEDCTLTGNLLECNWDLLEVGETRTILATTGACEIGCGPDIINTAHVGALHDTNPANDNDTAIIERFDCPGDVAVDKDGELLLSDEPGGDQVEFTITVTSVGDFAATNVVLTDHLPELDGSGYTTSGDDEDCTITDGTLECHFGDLEPGESRTVIVTSALCDIECEAVIENEAWVAADNDEDESNNHDGVVLIAPECPGDVAVDKEGELHLVDGFGDQVEFTIVVTSVGDFPARNATLTDHLPVLHGDVVVPWTVEGDSEGCEITDNTLFCEFGDLEPGESRTVILTSALCHIECEEVIFNEAWADAEDDTNPDNNHDNVTLQAPPCPGDVAVNKTGELHLVEGFGDQIEFTITVTSVGDFTATNVTLTDPLPDLHGHIGGWTTSGDDEGCSIDEGTLLCSFGDLTPGESRTVTLLSELCHIDCEEVIFNEAWVDADNDENESNNHDSATLVAPACPGDAAVNKTGELLLSDGPGGDQVEFTITVSSVGDFTATNVTLTDHLPVLDGSGWTTSGDDEDCSITDGTLTCEFGDLAPGESRTVIVTSALCEIECEQVIFNEAWVSADNDENDANDHDDVTLEAPECPGDVAVEKTGQVNDDGDFSGATFEDSVEFTITTTNVGTGPAFDVVLTDTLPVLDGQPWSIVAGGEDCEITDGNQLECDYGTLEAGESRSVTVESAVCELGCDMRIENTATATSSNDDNPENNSDSVTLDLPPCPDAAVDKTVEVFDQGNGFETVEYTIVVSNVGGSDASDVVLEDDLPDLNADWSISGDTEGCTLDATDRLVCEFGTLEPGESRTVVVTSTLCDIGCGPDIVNTAFVDTPGDINGQNDSDSAVIDRSDCPPA